MQHGVYAFGSQLYFMSLHCSLCWVVCCLGLPVILLHVCLCEVLTGNNARYLLWSLW